MASREHPTAVDLCAGAGGFSYGAQSCGFNVRAALELDPAAAATYRANIAEGDDMAVYREDITEFDPQRIHDVDDNIHALFAGPPCQPFSTAQGDPFDGKTEETVIYAVCDWVAKLAPAVLAIENVGGLARNHREVLDSVCHRLEDLGYTISTVTLQAEDFGVPQERERTFILGVSEEFPVPAQWEPPHVRSASAGQTTFGNLTRGLESYETASDALDGLPEPLAPQKPAADSVHMTPPGGCEDYVDPRTTPTWVLDEDDGYTYGGFSGDLMMPPNHVAHDHSRETREKYATWPLGYCGSRTTDRRLHPDQPAPTMTVSNGSPPVHFAGQAPGNGAPVDQVRRLTPREVAKLQTFPDPFAFGGTRLDQYRLAGNAVPPLLATHVADHLLRTVADTLGFAHLYDHERSSQEKSPTPHVPQ